MKDTRNRRTPWGGRQPTGKYVHLRKRDFATIDKLDIHGDLPTTYLHSLVEAGDELGYVKRLRDLYHESNICLGKKRLGYPLLDKDQTQHETLMPRSARLVYRNTPAARRLLVEVGMRGEEEPHVKLSGKASEYDHRLATSCTTASIELGARKKRHLFIPQREITSDFPIPSKPENVRPDGLFQIDYGKETKTFILEVVRTNCEKAVAELIIKQYRYIYEKKIYKDHLNTDKLITLFVFTNMRGFTNLTEAYKEATTKKNGEYGGNPLLFKYVPEFDGIRHVPPVLTSLYTEPWYRVGRVPFDISKV